MKLAVIAVTQQVGEQAFRRRRYPARLDHQRGPVRLRGYRTQRAHKVRVLYALAGHTLQHLRVRALGPGHAQLIQAAPRQSHPRKTFAVRRVQFETHLDAHHRGNIGDNRVPGALAIGKAMVIQRIEIQLEGLALDKVWRRRRDTQRADPADRHAIGHKPAQFVGVPHILAKSTEGGPGQAGPGPGPRHGKQQRRVVARTATDLSTQQRSLVV